MVRVSSPPQSRSKAVVCVSTPRMYPRSGYFLIYIYILVFKHWSCQCKVKIVHKGQWFDLRGMNRIIKFQRRRPILNIMWFKSIWSRWPQVTSIQKVWILWIVLNFNYIITLSFMVYTFFTILWKNYITWQAEFLNYWGGDANIGGAKDIKRPEFLYFLGHISETISKILEILGGGGGAIAPSALPALHHMYLKKRK